MALITEKKKDLSGGVNQQLPVHRLGNQVEEMINCVPTVDRGLMKRSPTRQKRLTNLDGRRAELDYDLDMWTYEYDRGTGGDNLSEFSFSVTSKGLQVVNVNTGVVYKEFDGLNYKGFAKQYLFPFGGRMGYSATVVKDTVFLTNKLKQPRMFSSNEYDPYKRRGYIWIKRADFVNGYSYGASIHLVNIHTEVKTVINVAETLATDTVAGASQLANAISTTSTLVGASASGSNVEITCDDDFHIEAVNATDDFGNLASFGWAWQVDSMAELPNNMGAFTPLVRVGTSAQASYWMMYKEGAWREHYQVGIDTEIDATTMPHIVHRQYNKDTGHVEFYVEVFDWSDRAFGDDKTNKRPSFLTPEMSTPIKDIFFFRNRMGLITESSITMSEVGEYGNFFRTSVAALLDGDRIDSGVESKHAVRMEYALVYDDSVVMFSDKSQFRFSGGNLLSPASYTITEITTNEVNIAVRPITLNDRIFFVAKRGNYSAVYEMFISNQSTRSSGATDISSHCQSYIHEDVDRLTGSPVNNMLFITSREDRRVMFAYKYYESGGQKHQSAWFKWRFNGDIYAGFAIGKDFHLMINRDDAVRESDWILGTGRWIMSKLWKMDAPWIMSPASLDGLPQFESMEIFPPEPTEARFIDTGFTTYESFVNFGEWVMGTDGNKEIRGSLKMKTIIINGSDDSTFDLWVKDKMRDTIRVVEHKYIKGRKPMVYGDSKNIETGFISDDETGFKIASVSFEGDFNKRQSANR